MSDPSNPSPSPDTQAMLNSLRLAVSKTLERKLRLGQYVVQWDKKAPIISGEDAPAEFRTPRWPQAVQLADSPIDQ